MLYLLVCKNIPDAVARQDEELVAGLQLQRAHFRKSGDHLLRGWQALVPFILQVAKRARQVQAAVDSPVTDEAAGLHTSAQPSYAAAEPSPCLAQTSLVVAHPLNTGVLLLVCRLVVVRHRHGRTRPGAYAARVASIRDH